MRARQWVALLILVVLRVMLPSATAQAGTRGCELSFQLHDGKYFLPSYKISGTVVNVQTLNPFMCSPVNNPENWSWAWAAMGDFTLNGIAQVGYMDHHYECFCMRFAWEWEHQQPGTFYRGVWGNPGTIDHEFKVSIQSDKAAHMYVDGQTPPNNAAGVPPWTGFPIYDSGGWTNVGTAQSGETLFEYDFFVGTTSDYADFYNMKQRSCGNTYCTTGTWSIYGFSGGDWHWYSDIPCWGGHRNVTGAEDHFQIWDTGVSSC